MRSLWGKIKSGAALVGVVIVALAVAFFKGRQAGKDIRSAEQQRARDALQEHYDEIDGRPRDPSDAYGRLRGLSDDARRR